MITKSCAHCKKQFDVPNHRALIARFCSRQCWTTSAESRKIHSIYRTGKKMSEETKEKIRQSCIGKN